MTSAPERPRELQADWVVCPDCRSMIYGKRLVRDVQVCPECGSHHRQTAHDRIERLFDAGSIRCLQPRVRSGDPLGFHDTRPYPERVEDARARTGLSEGVVVVDGSIGGQPVIAAVMDFRFLGGSLGSAIGELITLAAEAALEQRRPLLIVSASGGARMQEGAIALMQMAKTSAALARLDEAGVLTISLITDPTYGGVAASFSTLCDVIVAEPGARLGFAGPRVIEQTIRQTLPEGFQTAEFLLESGFLDVIEPRPTLPHLLGRLAGLQDGAPVPSDAPCSLDGILVRRPEELDVIDPWAAVQDARELARPTTLDYLHRVFDDFEELHGDRLGGDCPALVGGPARLGELHVIAIGHQKGCDARELAKRNYGMPNPAGYRKAARLMRLASKMGLPIVTFIDTPGAYPGLEAEQHGQAVAIAENIKLMASLPVPVVSVVTGEGGSGGALALAVADDVLMFSRAVYSVISPEGCAAILWNDPSRAADAAGALRMDARQLLGQGVVDGVVVEPEGGPQADPLESATRLRAALSESLRALCPVPPGELVERRRARFRAFGTADVTEVDRAAVGGAP